MTRDELVEKMLYAYFPHALGFLSEEKMRMGRVLDGTAEELLKPAGLNERSILYGGMTSCEQDFNSIMEHRKSALLTPQPPEAIRDLLKQSLGIAMSTSEHRLIEGLIETAFQRGKDHA